MGLSESAGLADPLVDVLHSMTMRGYEHLKLTEPAGSVSFRCAVSASVLISLPTAY